MNWIKLFEHRFFKLGILLILVVFLIPETFFMPPRPGLDPSWQIAVNLAIKHHLVFGKDFIFTYGPLSIISTRLPIAVSKYTYLLIDLYLLGTFFLVLRDVAVKHFKVGPFLYIFIAVSLSVYDMAHFLFFVFMLFYLCSFLVEPGRKVPVIQAAILSLISLYCKLSLGIVAVVLYVAAIVFVAIQRRVSLGYAVVVLCLYTALLVGSAFALHVDLIGYVGSSLHIINAYNDAMLRPLEKNFVVYLCAAVLIIALGLAYIVWYIVIHLKRRTLFSNLHYGIMLGAICLAIYIVFKNGFVRGEGHNMYFFKSIVLILPLLYYFLTLDKKMAKVAAIVCWISLFVTFCVADTIGGYQPGKRLYTFDFIPNKYREVTRYIETFLGYDDFVANPPEVSHDNQWKNIIGDKTVDILPTEISIAYFNDLKYNPRPIMQSYSAYDAYLDSLNAAKYRSDTAPDYILFSVASIDNRVPFFDETRTKLAILENYRHVKTIDNIMLLERRAGYRIITEKDRTVEERKFEENIDIPQNAQLLFTTFETEYNLIGKIKRLFFKPPALSITFTYDNGTTRTFNGIKPILAGGVLSNKFINLTDEFSSLMHRYGPFNTRVRNIKIEPVNSAWGFKDRIKIVHKWINLDNSTAAGRTDDSLQYAAQFSQYLPDSISLSSAVDTMKIVSNIEYSELSSQYFIYAYGWAYIQHQNNKDTKISVVLRAPNGAVTVMKTQMSERPDVAGYFQRDDVLRSGFLGKMIRSDLAEGTYTLGLMLENNGVKAFRFFDEQQLARPTSAKVTPISGDRAWIEKTNKDLNFNIEVVREVDSDIIIQGWAYLKGASPQPELKVLFVGDKNVFMATADRNARPDVEAHFGSALAKDAGFQLMLPKGALPAGSYTLVVDMQREGDHVATAVSDKTVKISDTAQR